MAAVRYDGRFPDPLKPGAFLPRVRYWQPWNEPNLSYYLSPQWTRTGGRWAPASAGIYRGLLNAFYAAVKRVSSSNFVVTAGTALRAAEAQGPTSSVSAAVEPRDRRRIDGPSAD
jgi:hypothetical protein